MKFKVGDKVKIRNGDIINKYGNRYHWYGDMGKFIGIPTYITEAFFECGEVYVTDSGFSFYKLNVDGGYHWYCDEWFEKVR